jgi:hypothetical protein
MMLPSNRPPMPPMPHITSAPLSSAPASTTACDNNPAHADYNLLPLEVSGLDHYVERDDDERFHVH